MVADMKTKKSRATIYGILLYQLLPAKNAKVGAYNAEQSREFSGKNERSKDIQSKDCLNKKHERKDERKRKQIDFLKKKGFRC